MKKRISMDDDNPAYPLLVGDLIENILQYADNPGDCANYITTQIRELVGVRIAAIVEYPLGKEKPESWLIDICPPRKKDLWESPEMKAYLETTLEFSEPRFVDPLHEREGVALAALNLGSAFVIPLIVNKERFGAIHLIGLMDVTGVSAILKSLSKASRIFAFVLKNAFLYRDLELTVRERTKELAESEQIFRALFEQASDGIFILSSEGEVLSVNDSFARMHGRTTQEMIDLGIRGLDVEGATPMSARLKKALSGQTLTFQVEHHHKDGHILPLEVTINPINIGGETRILATHRDITERREAERKKAAFSTQLEEKVRIRTAELEIANKEMESFAYSVSHDLRSPLRSIHGFTQIFLDTYGSQIPQDGMDYLNRVKRATLKMGNLIDDLLSLSRVSMGELHMKTIDISALASEIYGELSQDKKERTIVVHIQPSMSARGDPALIRIALENLIGNALKFTSKKRETHIEIGSSPANAEMSKFYIKDNGAGFDPSFIDDLFIPFHRLHSYEEFPGNGIGLATVQRIIRKHGGELTADGIPDGGATFKFTLPRAAN